MSVILTLLVHDRGTLDDLSLQGLTAARGLADQLGVELGAVLIGEEAGDMAGITAAYGAAKTYLVHHDILSDYAPEAWGESLAQLVAGTEAMALVGIGTDRGNEVLAHTAASTGLPMVANCIAVEAGSEPWHMTRIRWGGSLHERTTLEAGTKLLSFAPHAVEAEAAPVPGSGATEAFTPVLDSSHAVTRVVDRVTATEGMTLATSPVVVCGGRGVGSPEGFAPLEELAGLLGGVVGCSRVVTNNGWRPHRDQVGQTGTAVAPDLYIGCGVSGAIQHWVGMMGSKTILAINTDAEAPMVTKADYAVVADLAEAVPAIVDEVKRRRG